MQTKNLSRFALALVTAVLTVSNGLLLYQNLELRKTVDRAKRLVTDVGFQFSDVPATTTAGESKSISFGHDGKQTVLLIFNTNCVYCLQQYPSWKKLAAGLDRDKWNIIAVTSQSDVDLVVEHLAQHGLADLDVRLVAPDDIGKARMGFTPMTIFVDSTGVVQSVFPGLSVAGYGVGD